MTRISLWALCMLMPTMAIASTCSPKSPEMFVEFLPSFTSSKAFALKRTVLPLPLVREVDGVDVDGRTLHGTQKSYLSAAEYWRWPSLDQYMRDNDLLSQIRTQTKSAAVVELYKDGLDGQVLFHFKTQGGCWFLWQYEVKQGAESS